MPTASAVITRYFSILNATFFPLKNVKSLPVTVLSPLTFPLYLQTAHTAPPDTLDPRRLADQHEDSTRVTFEISSASRHYLQHRRFMSLCEMDHVVFSRSVFDFSRIQEKPLRGFPASYLGLPFSPWFARSGRKATITIMF